MFTWRSNHQNRILRISQGIPPQIADTRNRRAGRQRQALEPPVVNGPHLYSVMLPMWRAQQGYAAKLEKGKDVQYKLIYQDGSVQIIEAPTYTIVRGTCIWSKRMGRGVDYHLGEVRSISKLEGSPVGGFV
jgi:hypothetical protein